jgi:hypothetical protein
MHLITLCLSPERLQGRRIPDSEIVAFGAPVVEIMLHIVANADDQLAQSTLVVLVSPLESMSYSMISLCGLRLINGNFFSSQTPKCID